MTDISNEHLAELQKCIVEDPLDPDDVSGKTKQPLYKMINRRYRTQPGFVHLNFSDGIRRSDIFGLSKQMVNSTEFVCALALAWGGINVNHFIRAFENKKDWLAVAEGIRQGKLDRSSAYNGFAEIRKQKKMVGVGPAFFTKLIYFLMPSVKKKKGLIMDQWSGCSINVMCNKEVVLMDVTTKWKRRLTDIYQESTFTVSDANTGENYEEFCQVVEEIRDRTRGDLNLHSIDRALVSVGKRNPGKWRQYVISKRSISR